MQGDNHQAENICGIITRIRMRCDKQIPALHSQSGYGLASSKLWGASQWMRAGRLRNPGQIGSIPIAPATCY